MKKIKCQNCTEEVIFSDKLQCKECNCKLYGYNINTIPTEYKKIIDDNFKTDNNSTPPIPPPEPKDPPFNSINNNNHDRKEDKINNRQQPEPSPIFKPKPPTHPGWLIVHTEGREAKEFQLIDGINYIGSPRQIDIQPHIEVPDDPFVSRGHAVLCISKNPRGKYNYTLSDDANNQRKRKSTNGTYINGKSERVSDGATAILKDGDTLQMGETKLVLKTTETAATLDEAKTQVKNMNYLGTIFMNKK